MHKNAHARKLRDLTAAAHTHVRTHAHTQTLANTHSPIHTLNLNYGQSCATVAWFIAAPSPADCLLYFKWHNLKSPRALATAGNMEFKGRFF